LVDDSQEFLNWAEPKLGQLAADCSEFSIRVRHAEPSAPAEDATRRLRTEGAIQAVVVDWDLASARGGGRATGIRNGAQLIQQIQSEFPSIYVSLLTGAGVMGVLVSEESLTARPFDKDDPTALEELFADILDHLRRRETTPFFEALREYSERPTSVFHAMALSRGKAVRKSGWLRDFHDFYGDRVFLAETSATQTPLDSLLSPHGSIQDAQERAARAFHADRTFFITNGTSTANKIVHQGLLAPDDKVLIDRNCHKSHHYGLVLMGSRPIYLQAEPLVLPEDDEFTGICKGVSIDEIIGKLEQTPDAKMLCLSNCTFDGYIHDPKHIIERVLAKLDELRLANRETGPTPTPPQDFVFLFDEAWFAFASFLPQLRRFTAMHASANLPDPRARVYATQSTHKTLTAFRQASMIHVRDPKFEEIEHFFEEAVFTHSTTSPNYNIIASLDAGRRQAELEGPSLTREAWELAAKLRHFFDKERLEDTRLAQYFRALTPSEMGAAIPDGDGEAWRDFEFTFDPTKITIYLPTKSGLTGDKMRKRLLDEFGIQFNKVTSNTMLLMVNAGATESSLGHLITALRRIAAELDSHPPAARRIALDADVFRRPVSFHAKDNDLRRYFFRRKPKAGALERISLTQATEKLRANRTLVNANFVIPYPPGFPVLVPGQLVEQSAIDYLHALGNQEIHGMPSPGTIEVWQM
jgi:arginine decarboxylase